MMITQFSSFPSLFRRTFFQLLLSLSLILTSLPQLPSVQAQTTAPAAELLVLAPADDPLVQALVPHFATMAVVDPATNQTAHVYSALAQAQIIVTDVATWSLADLRQTVWFRAAQALEVPLVLLHTDPARAAAITGMGIAGQVVVVRSAERGRSLDLTILEASDPHMLAETVVNRVRQTAPLVTASTLAGTANAQLPSRVKQTWTVDGASYTKLINNTTQELSADIDFQVTLYDSTLPQAAKWLQITTIGPGVNPGRLVSDSDSDRGYYLEELQLTIDPGKWAPSLLALDKHTPATQQEDGAYSRTTGLEVGIGLDGPSVGYSASSAETLNLADFRIINDTAGKKAAWRYRLRKVGTGTPYESWQDLRYFNATGWPLVGVHTLPAQAKANLQVGSEAIYRLPADYQESLFFNLSYLATLRRVSYGSNEFSSQADWLLSSQTISIDFSQVNYEGDLYAGGLNFSSLDPAQRNIVAATATISARMADYENVEVIFYTGPCGSQQSREIGRTLVDLPSGFNIPVMITWDTDGLTGEQPVWVTVAKQPGETNADNNEHCANINLTQAQVYVDANARGQNTGASWQDAYLSLQDALAAVRGQFSTAIWVAEGVYKPSQDNDRLVAFELSDGIQLYGGFPSGGGDGSFAARHPTGHPTVLDGDIGRQGEASDNSYNVVRIPHLAPVGLATIIDGFTIRGGYASGNPTTVDWIYTSGGGIVISGKNKMMLRNLVIEDNYAKEAGGGLYGSGMLVNVLFRNNTASSGAGMSYPSGSPTLVNVAFIGNRAYSDSFGYGRGGGLSGSGKATLINVSMSGNSANQGGAALYVSYGPVTITNSIFWNNDGHGIGFEPGSDPNQHENIPVVRNSLVAGGWDWNGGNNIDADPLFLAPTDLRLRPGSPAIDAGDNSALPAGVITDVAGNPRRVGYTGAAVVDLGAYEALPPGVSVTSPDPVVRENGDAVTVALRLQSPPMADVVVDFSTDGQMSVAPVALTFTPSNWATPQAMAITAVDNPWADGLRSGVIRYQVHSADPTYAGLPIADSVLTVEDDEVAAVIIEPLTVRLQPDAKASYSMLLATPPAQDVMITPTAESGISTSPASLTFTPANWNTPQQVTVAAVASDLAPRSFLIYHTVSSSNRAYDGMPLPAVQVTVEHPHAPVNQPPVAEDDTATLLTNTVDHVIAVLANDSDPDNDPLTIVAVGNPVHGVVTTDGQTLFYTPSPGHEGADSFSYTIDDGRGGTATALVTIIDSPVESPENHGLFLPLVRNG